MKKWIAVLISVMSCFVLTVNVYALGPSSPSIYNGIDVSNWQGEIDFLAVKQAGVDIVYIKTSQGTNEVDPYFEQNYKNAKSADLNIGVYHYVMAQTSEEAKQEAAFFVETISGKEIDCSLAMDFETFADLSVQQINQIGLTFLQEVERLSQKSVIVYSDASNANYLWNDEIAKYGLWVADYQVPELTSLVFPPLHTNGVEEPRVFDQYSSWVGYQYSSAGNVPGIEGNSVDLDYFTSDIYFEKPEIDHDISQPTTGQNSKNVSYYTVESGDTLTGIASSYGVTISQLVNWNDIANANLIYVGEVLSIYQPSGASGESNSVNQVNQQTYVVESGDTLTGIASSYGVSVSELVNWNDIANANLIYVGEVLSIYQPLGVAGESNSTNQVNQQTYVVESGDTLTGIANSYGVTVSELVNWNDIENPNLIYVGEEISIY